MLYAYFYETLIEIIKTIVVCFSHSCSRTCTHEVITYFEDDISLCNYVQFDMKL